MMCTCAVHCPESPHHERACCDRDCDCPCHGPYRVWFGGRESPRERFRRFHTHSDALDFADRNFGWVETLPVGA